LTVFFNPRRADAGKTDEWVRYPRGTRSFLVQLAVQKPTEFDFDQVVVYVLPSELGARRFFAAYRRYFNNGWIYVGDRTFFSAALQRRRNVVAIWTTEFSPRYFRTIVLGCLKTQAQNL
jgi:hypothetical protein